MPRPPTHVEPGRIRETLLVTALHLFGERGYFKTTIPELARAARVGVGSVYHHFADKEDLARSLFRELNDGLIRELTAIAELHASAHDRCRAAIAMLFRITEANPEAMAFLLYAKHREFLPDEPPVCSSQPFAAMREFVVAGMASGEVGRMDPLVASASLYGGALRLMAARLDGVLAQTLPTLLDDTWECAWRSVAATPRPHGRLAAQPKTQPKPLRSSKRTSNPNR